jgi:sialate O-acetylesterase
MFKGNVWLTLTVCATLVVALASAAFVLKPMEPKLTLPAILSTNMVVQRGKPVPIWGTAKPGASVSVKLLGRAFQTTADASGRWRGELEPIDEEGPGELFVSDGETNLTAENVLVGDVWICSGQSNMEWTVSVSNNPDQEIAAANYPKIRLFQVARIANVDHQGDVQGKWVECSPQTIANFSAVGYFFGRSLHRTARVPMGLIDTTWGGTPAEAWTSREALLADPVTKPIVDRYDAEAPNFAEAMKRYDEVMKERPGGVLPDPGNQGEAAGWAGRDHDLSDWKSMDLPAYMESAGPDMEIDGAVWFRREVELTAAQAEEDWTLSLGPIDDFDVTYVNGQVVGRTGVETTGFWQHPRVYTVSKSVLRAGKNVIAVRVFDQGYGGGIYGQPEQLSLVSKSGARVALQGTWNYKVEFGRPQVSGGLIGPRNPNSPVALHSTMIRPLAPFGIRGAIWYQGESNAGRAEQYRTLLPTMIKDWRTLWGQGDFPFLIVQLANFMDEVPEPVDSDWAELRDAQTFASESVGNSALAVAIDIGEAADIHPRNKQDVGERLALAARDLLRDLPGPRGRSPILSKFEVGSDKVVIRTKYASALRTKDGAAPKGFAIAGADRKFVWAEAKIVGTSIEVMSPKVPNPVAVRYAWAHNPAVNVVNELSLPLSPFRTDTWPGVTDGRR